MDSRYFPSMESCMEFSFFLGLRFSSYVLFQCIEAHVPEPAVLLEPRGRLAKRLGFQRAQVLPAVDFAADQSGPLKHHDVLGYRVQGHGEGSCNFGDGGGFLRQSFKDRAPRCVRYGGKHPIQRRRGIFNHMVEYYYDACPRLSIQNPKIAAFLSTRGPPTSACE